MNYSEGIKQIEKAHKIIVEANQMISDSTLNSVIFTWRWWIGVAMIIIPWIVWFFYRKKESSSRLLFASFIFVIMATSFDTMGAGFGKWDYPVKVIPIPTISYFFIYSVLPVGLMFFIQVKPNVNPLIKAILFGGLYAYIGLPILRTLDMYKQFDWAYTYSFIILFFMYLISYWFSQRNSFREINN